MHINKDAKTNKWHCRETYIIEGKKIRKNFSGKTRKEALEKKNLFDLSCGTLDRSRGQQMNFKKAFEHYLYAFKKPNSLPQTAARDRTTANLILQSFEKYRLCDVTTEAIQINLINKLFKDGKSHSTVKKCYVLLNQFMRYCANKGIVERNPMDNKAVLMPPVKEYATETRALSDLEADALLEESKRRTAHGYRAYKYAYELYTFALNTGMRQGEIFGLQWKYVDLEKRCIYVRDNLATYFDGDTGKVISGLNPYPKTATSKRELYINDAVMDVLVTMYEKKQEGFVFASSTGKHLTPAGVDKSLRNIKDRVTAQGIDISFMTFHTFRHTFAVNLYKTGASIATIQRLLGHTNYKTTVDTYINLFNSNDPKIDDILMDAMKGLSKC